MLNVLRNVLVLAGCNMGQLGGITETWAGEPRVPLPRP